MTDPTHCPDAAPDVLAADDAASDLRRVFAMHSASPPEDIAGGDRSPAINRVIASLAGGYCSTNLDVRDVRCLVVAFADAEGIIDALNGQLATARADLARLRAPLAGDLAAIEARAVSQAAALDALRAEAREHGDDSYGYGICRVLSVLPRGVDPDVTALLARTAAHAAALDAAVAAARTAGRAAVTAERDMWEAQIATTTTDAAEALDIVDDLVRYAMNTHPLPWRIEDDWTREVTAADGAIVAKCMTFARAEAIIAAAERIAADRAKHADDFAELDGAAS